MTKSLLEMQKLQHEWSRKNFPDRRADHAIMGLIEEVGELCEGVVPEEDTPAEYLVIMDMMRWLGKLSHINLKRAQGIRKASTSFDNECDAIDQLCRSFWEYYTNVSYPPDPNVSYVPTDPSEEKEKDAIGDILVYLLDRCNRKGDWDLEEIANTTLGQVLKRDWCSNKEDGSAA